jgi:hypothetical protein
MQHQSLSRPPVRPVPVEFEGEPLGVAVPYDGGYRFLAVRFSAFPIDGQTFETLEATRAALGAAVLAQHNARLETL